MTLRIILSRECGTQIFHRYVGLKRQIGDKKSSYLSSIVAAIQSSKTIRISLP